MAEAKHTPAGDRSFGVSVLRNVAGGIALVAAMAALFWVIGSIGRADDPQLADPPADEAGGSPSADGGTADDTATDDPIDEAPSTNGGAPTSTADDPGAEGPADGSEGPSEAGDDPPEDVDEPDAPDEPDDPDEAPTDEGGGEDGPGDDGGQPADIDRSTVTVQILDGYQDDGGAAAAALADELRAAGYDVVAENPALRYDVTAVLYTAGNEAAAQQVAAEIDAAEVRAQPGNLSEQVMVHVVVGADRA